MIFLPIILKPGKKPRIFYFRLVGFFCFVACFAMTLPYQTFKKHIGGTPIMTQDPDHRFYAKSKDREKLIPIEEQEYILGMRFKRTARNGIAIGLGGVVLIGFTFAPKKKKTQDKIHLDLG